MIKNHDNHEEYIKIEILENAIVVYNNGKKEFFDAIYVSEKWVNTGSVSIIEGRQTFISWGGILRENILRIEGGIAKHIYKNEERKT